MDGKRWVAWLKLLLSFDPFDECLLYHVLYRQSLFSSQLPDSAIFVHVQLSLDGHGIVGT